MLSGFTSTALQTTSVFFVPHNALLRSNHRSPFTHHWSITSTDQPHLEQLAVELEHLLVVSNVDLQAGEHERIFDDAIHRYANNDRKCVHHRRTRW